MSEAQWAECSHPEPMLVFLQEQLSERKCRLFSCACCRRLWHLLTDARSRLAIEVAEHYADGQASSAELAHAARAARFANEPDDLIRHAASGVAAGSSSMCFATARSITEECAAAVQKASGSLETRRAEEKAQSDLLRDIVANPFGPCPTVASSVLVWNDATVVKLAQGIYRDKAFDRLPILADVLADAGCDDPYVLGHCRQPGSHVRGCWVLDLLTGRQ